MRDDAGNIVLAKLMLQGYSVEVALPIAESYFSGERDHMVLITLAETQEDVRRELAEAKSKKVQEEIDHKLALALYESELQEAVEVQTEEESPMLANVRKQQQGRKGKGKKLENLAELEECLRWSLDGPVADEVVQKLETAKASGPVVGTEQQAFRKNVNLETPSAAEEEGARAVFSGDDIANDEVNMAEAEATSGAEWYDDSEIATELADSQHLEDMRVVKGLKNRRRNLVDELAGLRGEEEASHPGYSAKRSGKLSMQKVTRSNCTRSRT